MRCLGTISCCKSSVVGPVTGEEGVIERRAQETEMSIEQAPLESETLSDASDNPRSSHAAKTGTSHTH